MSNRSKDKILATYCFVSACLVSGWFAQPIYPLWMSMAAGAYAGAKISLGIHLLTHPKEGVNA